MKISVERIINGENKKEEEELCIVKSDEKSFTDRELHGLSGRLRRKGKIVSYSIPTLICINIQEIFICIHPLVYKGYFKHSTSCI